MEEDEEDIVERRSRGERKVDDKRASGVNGGRR